MRACKLMYNVTNPFLKLKNQCSDLDAFPGLCVRRRARIVECRMRRTLRNPFLTIKAFQKDSLIIVHPRPIKPLVISPVLQSHCSTRESRVSAFNLRQIIPGHRGRVCKGKRHRLYLSIQGPPDIDNSIPSFEQSLRLFRVRNGLEKTLFGCLG